jgi:hypothetical protein
VSLTPKRISPPFAVARPLGDQVDEGARVGATTSWQVLLALAALAAGGFGGRGVREPSSAGAVDGLQGVR